jgi:hypothetical protein
MTRAIHLVPDKGLSSNDGVNSLTASSGTTSTLVDTTDLPPAGASSALFANQWLWRPNANNTGDYYRTIGGTGYAASTQTITAQAPVYTEAPTGGTDDGVYRITRDPPWLWNRALNEALRTECFFVEIDEFTPTSNTQRRYVLTAAPISISDLTRKTQIANIQWHPANDTAGEELWRDWADGRREWEVEEDDSAITIDFRFVPPATTQELRIISTQPYTTLTDETTSINVDLEWAAWATLLWMARYNKKDEEWQEIGKDALEFVRDRRRQELEQFSYRTVGRESQFVGAVSVGGRGGRGRAGVSRRTFHN